MLLEMRFSNFFSIKDEISIDFKAGNINTATAKALADNVFKANDETLLKVQGLFGPNASGKSSILKAALFCRQLVIDSFQNNEGATFTFTPFKFDGYYEKPSSFFIDFITDGIEYEYSFRKGYIITPEKEEPKSLQEMKRLAQQNPTSTVLRKDSLQSLLMLPKARERRLFL